MEVLMPNTRQARKRMRTDETRRQRNSAYKTKIRSYRKRFLVAVEGGEKEAAAKAFSELISLYDRAVIKGVLKRNTADRSKSRYAGRLNAIAG